MSKLLPERFAIRPVGTGASSRRSLRTLPMITAALATAFLVASSATWAQAICGDGVLEAGEQCDPGLDVNGDCCTFQCQFTGAGSVCRSSAGPCDVADTCSGASAACPDVKSTGVCRASAGFCDVPESCDGFGNQCPTDRFAPATLTCRASAGACDAVERCTGNAAGCPADAKRAAGSTCRAAFLPCDVAETCDGINNDCPAENLFKPAGELCRDVADVCDVAETCSGTSALCPADAKVEAGTPCRAPADLCDAEEVCDGTNAACPADALLPFFTVCRAAAAGSCDVTERCDGQTAACPADAVRPAEFLCRPAIQACDLPESCDGESAECPFDQVEAAGVICRESTGVCDITDTCNGEAKNCPNEVVENGTSCADDDFCDGSEVCLFGSCIPPANPPCAGGECDEEIDECIICGDGFAAQAEECGEPGLPACSVDTICSNCACVDPGPQLSAEPICGFLGSVLQVPVSLMTNERDVSSVGFSLAFPPSVSLLSPLLGVSCADEVDARGFNCQGSLGTNSVQVLVTPPVGPLPVPTLPDGELVTVIFQVDPEADPGAPTCSVEECALLDLADEEFGDSAAQPIPAGSTIDGCVDVVECTQGDCNANGNVTTADVTCDTQRIFGTREQSSPCEDCNGDGDLTSADVTCIILCLFGSCPSAQ